MTDGEQSVIGCQDDIFWLKPCKDLRINFFNEKMQIPLMSRNCLEQNETMEFLLFKRRRLLRQDYQPVSDKRKYIFCLQSYKLLNYLGAC